MNRLAGLLFFLFCLFAGFPLEAQERMRVSLLSETPSAPPGTRILLAFHMQPAPGWHGYWRNPGDAGAEPRVVWQVPPGWQAGPLLYPVPDRLNLLGLMNYTYEEDYVLLAAVEVPRQAAAGSVARINAKLDYLVCSDELCVPETAIVTVPIRVGPAGASDPAFARFRQALPRPLSQPAAYALTGGRLRLAIPLPAGTPMDDPYFYPVSPDLVAHSAPQSLSRNGDFLIVESEAKAGAAPGAVIEGVLEMNDGVGLSIRASPGIVPPAGEAIAATAFGAASLKGLILALLGAILGGLLLNIMPCVFPILSLKALSLVRAGETPQAARREAVAYSAGVILTCLALGGLLLALRAAGVAAGWAFQLQDPRIILLLLLLVTAIGLGLAGLFHLPAYGGGDALTRRGGARGAFFTGSLAAFVATPCTGPFLGFALGAALVLPTLAGLAVFAGLGLGLALPFLLLGFVPALRNLLPKPGPWMGRFQKMLAVPMFLTALALAWILGRQSGVDGMTLGLAAALALALALWWLGARRPGASFWPPLLVLLIAILVPLTLVRTAPASPSSQSLAASTVPFDEGRLAQLRAERRPVFLYFTADWCITCKVNERAAIGQSEVAAAFRTGGVVTMAGDWTRGDPAISRFLERHGRSGVPLYLYYAPGAEPEILPQILTVSRLTGLVR